MTLHELTLPGVEPSSSFCRADYCQAEITEETKKEDTYEAWRAACDKGEPATTSYVEKYKILTHRPNCPYRELPPSVHLWCRNRDGESAALDKELERLKKARGS